MNHVEILGVPFIHSTRNEFVDILHQRIKQQKKTFVVTANPEIVMMANENKGFMEYLQAADFITPDGIGIVKAAGWLKKPLPERVPGFDTMKDLLSLANENQYRVYFLGAKQEVLDQFIHIVSNEYPKMEIAGFRNGFFDLDNPQIAEEICGLKPDLIFVALGAPRQEQWIYQNIGKFDKGIFMGVGGSFDGIAGVVPRAPEIWQKLNIEWLYRLIQQPTRWKRMLAIPRFVFKVLLQKTNKR
ncbi:WecB/TagA/CpsF family glycosyltransferase [Heyndrickxia vini]|uniref:N-acetylglucosaminyldiphosphoundecaprenol N-acetyl-beta-D-mannosaminyltransferase n=1 Tax=Heyndrickxia vini TaxID=1476025 RepID=A0ABX7E3V7_9BACI|nr:WecB/TagA/CpsF family glycosyltransferase [Heyndrickxia vini]QQZ10251.1 WecB/TagA/CpsF family glycosyltransferase [Heyndrickxia vini]